MWPSVSFAFQSLRCEDCTCEDLGCESHCRGFDGVVDVAEALALAWVVLRTLFQNGTKPGALRNWYNTQTPPRTPPRLHRLRPADRIRGLLLSQSSGNGYDRSPSGLNTARYLVSIPDNGDSRWSRYGLLAL
ncbi:hypothetical protein D9R19_00125 [Corynebacterium diphtheriae]|nr:hypothetical protein D9B36_00140 [Corynebacterium diphtheriae]RLP12030.1 hypothetical protein D9R17_00170 [Corynebacterium diphtheriae]RLP19887.1 hypothetical protein D9R19_00125 [Corynebacterium diphtheriae]